MKTTVIHAQPMQPPPIEKIILEVRPQELIALARIVGHDSSYHYQTPLWDERDHGVIPSTDEVVYDGLKAAMKAAGLLK